jgi:hypothetical protein
VRRAAKNRNQIAIIHRFYLISAPPITGGDDRILPYAHPGPRVLDGGAAGRGQAEQRLVFGRIVVSDIEALNMLAILV